MHLGLAAGLALAALTSVFLPASGAHVSPAVSGNKIDFIWICRQTVTLPKTMLYGIVAFPGVPGSSPPSPHLTTASSCHGNRAMWRSNCRGRSGPRHHGHRQGPLSGAAEDRHLPRVHAQLSRRARPAGSRGRAGPRLEPVRTNSDRFRIICRLDDRVGLCSRSYCLPRSSQPGSRSRSCLCGQQVAAKV